jgi:hypothetical protein
MVDSLSNSVKVYTGLFGLLMTVNANRTQFWRTFPLSQTVQLHPASTFKLDSTDRPQSLIEHKRRRRKSITVHAKSTPRRLLLLPSASSGGEYTELGTHLRSYWVSIQEFLGFAIKLQTFQSAGILEIASRKAHRGLLRFKPSTNSLSWGEASSSYLPAVASIPHTKMDPEEYRAAIYIAATSPRPELENERPLPPTPYRDMDVLRRSERSSSTTAEPTNLPIGEADQSRSAEAIHMLERLLSTHEQPPRNPSSASNNMPSMDIRVPAIVGPRADIHAEDDDNSSLSTNVEDLDIYNAEYQALSAGGASRPARSSSNPATRYPERENAYPRVHPRAPVARPPLTSPAHTPRSILDDHSTSSENPPLLSQTPSNQIRRRYERAGDSRVTEASHFNGPLPPYRTRPVADSWTYPGEVGNRQPSTPPQLEQTGEVVVPRWQPDAEVTFCPICRTQFSLFSFGLAFNAYTYRMIRFLYSKASLQVCFVDGLSSAF